MTVDATASPCINVCRMDVASGWCAGCLRTIDEIAAWARLDEDGRRAVRDAIERRRETPQARTLAVQQANQAQP